MSPIIRSINSTEVITWVVDNVVSGIIVAVIAGIIVTFVMINSPSFINTRITKWQEIRDKKRIYGWLYSKTKKYDGLIAGNIDGGVLGTRTDPRCYSTEDIASSNGFTVDKTRNLCYKHKDIKLMIVEEKERWAIKEIVDRPITIPNFINTDYKEKK